MTKAALFDLDDVIADTAAYHLQAWHKLIQDHFGLDAPTDLPAQTKGLSRTKFSITGTNKPQKKALDDSSAFFSF